MEEEAVFVGRSQTPSDVFYQTNGSAGSCFRFLSKTNGGSNGPILVSISRQHYLDFDLAVLQAEGSQTQSGICRCGIFPVACRVK